MSDPVILVGRRPDGGHRDMLWEWVRERWERTTGWQIHEGLHLEDEGPFSLSAASNRAAEAAGDWTVAVYIGADWIAYDAVHVMDAVRVAELRRQLVFAHDKTGVLPEDATGRLLTGTPLVEVAADAEWHTNTFSGVLAVPRSLWDEVGGFDERFVGWGYDDLAFWSACSAIGGGFERIRGGRILHLWHPRSRADNEDNPNFAANQVLGERYLKAKHSRGMMRGILRERWV